MNMEGESSARPTITQSPPSRIRLTPASPPERGRGHGSSLSMDDAVADELRSNSHGIREQRQTTTEIDLCLEGALVRSAQEPPSSYLDIVSLQPHDLDEDTVYRLLCKNVHRLRSMRCMDMSVLIADVLEAYAAPALEELEIGGGNIFPLSAFSPEAPRLSRLHLSSVDRLVLPTVLWSTITVFSVQHIQDEPCPKAMLRIIEALSPTVQILHLPCGLARNKPLPAPASIFLEHLKDLRLSGLAVHCAFVLKALEFRPSVTVLLDAFLSEPYSPYDHDLDRRLGIVNLMWGNAQSGAPPRTVAASYAAPSHSLGSNAQLVVHGWKYETVINNVPDFRISPEHPADVRADLSGIYDLGSSLVPQYAVYSLLLPALALETVCILSLRLEPRVENFGQPQDLGSHPGSACWDVGLWSLSFKSARQLSHLRVIAPGAAPVAVELVYALAHILHDSEGVEIKSPPPRYLLPMLRTLTLGYVPSNSTSLRYGAGTAIQAVRELIIARARLNTFIRIHITPVNAEDRAQWDAGLATCRDFVELSQVG